MLLHNNSLQNALRGVPMWTLWSLPTRLDPYSNAHREL